MERTLDFDAVCDALDSGATLVTANNRLARHLAGRFAEARSAAGASIWETPDILPLDAWLVRGHQQLADSDHLATRLLTSHQQRLLWEQQVRGSTLSDGLLRPDSAAALAAEAWERLCAWELDLSDLDPAAGKEVRALLDWARGFLRECERNAWLDPARLPGVVSRAAHAGALPLPPALIFAGFETLTPAVRGLAGALEETGCAVHELKPVTIRIRAVRMGLQDPRAELAAAASWAAGRLARNPRARLGIVIPDLSRRRAAVIHTLDALLHPEAGLSPREPPNRLYNLSLGEALADPPLVCDALLALRLLIRGLEFADLSTLLRSPFLGDGDSEYLVRCSLDTTIREWPDQQVPARGLVRIAKDTCPALARRLTRAGGKLEGGPASPATWSSRFRDALSALGWPGERSVDSSEYQQAQRLRDLVDDLPSVAVVEPVMDARRALACLVDMARHTTFQPESRSAVPVQVMGLLEADGQSFDGLWIMGLSDQQYPPAAEPHPLLPVLLQREHAMPRASAERELDFAEKLLDRLFGAAPEVIASWPLREGDQELLPTPLIAGLPGQPFDALGVPALLRLDERWLKALPLERIDDHHGVPLSPHGQVRGGTRLLLDQAACPFRAYAHHRLHAAGLADPVPGPSPLTRGNLLHAALEAFWKAVGSQQALLGCSGAALQAHIDAAVEQALGDAGRDLAGESRNLEQRRLRRRLASWLDIEAQRAPFTVAATEERREVAIGDLRINTLADRVDRLEDDRLVVIDYKSGGASRDGWFGDRLFEPQLPLYAVAMEDARVAAVAFARLRAGDTRFVGTAEDDGLLPDVTALARDRQRGETPDWPALLAHWQSLLAQLAAEVREGLAGVTPKKGDACAWCDLGDLCRVATVSDDQAERPEGAQDHD